MRDEICCGACPQWKFYEVSDADRCREVYERFYKGPLYSFYYGERIDVNKFVHMFTHCGAVLWEVCCDDKPVGIITAVLLTNSCVKMGIASFNGTVDIGAFSVLPRLEGRLRERGILSIVAEIPKFKDHVQKLMHYYGWNKTGEIPDYFGSKDDLLIYVKQTGG